MTAYEVQCMRAASLLLYLQVLFLSDQLALLAAVDGGVDLQEGHVLPRRGAVLPARLVHRLEQPAEVPPAGAWGRTHGGAQSLVI